MESTPERPRETIDDLDALLRSLPPEIVDAVNALPDRNALIEVVMDLGRRPEARFPDSEISLLDRLANARWQDLQQQAQVVRHLKLRLRDRVLGSVGH